MVQVLHRQMQRAHVIRVVISQNHQIYPYGRGLYTLLHIFLPFFFFDSELHILRYSATDNRLVTNCINNYFVLHRFFFSPPQCLGLSYNSLPLSTVERLLYNLTPFSIRSINTYEDEWVLLVPDEKNRYDLFLSFHGSEVLTFIKDSPTTRAFVSEYLIPEIHKKWKVVYGRKGKLAIFFDDLEIKDDIKNDIFTICESVLATN